MKNYAFFGLFVLSLTALVGCGGGGGGGGSATSTRELLTGGSSKVWKVSQAHANAKFRGGSDNPETFAPCPTRFGSLSIGVSDWTCGESDTIVFREDGTVDYNVGEIPGTKTYRWSLSGSTLRIIDIRFSQFVDVDELEVLDNGSVVIKRVKSEFSSVLPPETGEAGNSYVIVSP